MNKIITRRRLHTALNRQVPGASYSDIKTGDPVLVYRDGLRRWVGPHKFIEVSNKIPKVDFGEKLAQFSLHRCKSYNIDEEVRDLMTDQKNYAELQLRNNDLHQEKTPSIETEENF